MCNDFSDEAEKELKNNYYKFLEKQYLQLLPYENIQKEKKFYLTVVTIVSAIISFIAKDYLLIIIFEVIIMLLFIGKITLIDYTPDVISDIKSYKRFPRKLNEITKEVGSTYIEMEKYFKYYLGIQIILFILFLGIFYWCQI